MSKREPDDEGKRQAKPRSARPLRQHLSDDDNAALVARVWRRLDERDARSPRRFFAATVTAIACLLVAAVGFGVRERHHGRGRQPLMVRADEPLGVLEAATQPLRLPLSDGSEIALAPGSRLTTLQHGNGVIELALERGRAELDVRPGGPRRWVIDADLLSVEVVGTHFVVTRDHGSDEVSVSRGVVLVRGERVPDHVQRLTAGHSLRVEAAPAPPIAPAAPPVAPASSSSSLSSLSSSSRVKRAASSSLPANAAATPASAVTPPANVAASSVKSTAVATSTAVAAPAVVSPATTTPRQPPTSSPSALTSAHPASTAQLLEDVDALRRAGRRDQAIAMLQRLAYDDAPSPTAALAAFTLGRVLLDAPADPARATRAFERALHLGLPAGLSTDAIALCRDALAHAVKSATSDLPRDRCR